MKYGPRAQELQERAQRVMPGRQSNFRALSSDPFFLSSANGIRYQDVDGKEYIDFTLSMGSAIWGYSEQFYADGVKQQIDTLLAMSSGLAQSTLEVELAEAIVDRVPCAEWVRFGISGSEAVQLAIRLGRAYTSRPYFVRFAGHYHGWLDNVAGGSPDPNPNDKPFAIDRPGDAFATAGRSPHAFSESLMIPWNDLDALENLLKNHGDEIGAIIMEAIMCNFGCCPPRPGYLEGVRALADQYGCVLIFDEVITGFRTDAGGAQETVGVTPDLATFGKALAGGLPLSAVAGKKAILNLLRTNEVIGGGTFNAFPLGVAAAVTSMKLFDRDNRAAYTRMATLQDRLRQGMQQSAEKHGHDLLVQGPRGVTYMAFCDADTAWSPADLSDVDHAKAAKFMGFIKQEGVLMAGGNRWFVSPNHSEQDIDEALSVIDHAFSQLE